MWEDAKRAQDLGREKKLLDGVVQRILELESGLSDADELFEIARSEDDDSTLVSVEEDVHRLEVLVADLEFRRMFSNPADPSPCFMEIQAGAGGTEAQDWAQMLLRMYSKYCDKRGWKVELLDESEGEVAGLKSASIKVTGDHAFGYLRTETGIHRLVRKSPFDSNARRHTSFASVFVYPEVDDSIEIEINPADLRVDTYRASGAGGQHVNKTESAVRMTHLTTGIVVSCQTERSQVQNRENCLKMMRAKLYQYYRDEEAKKRDDKKAKKLKIEWGSQIRSYVLDDRRVKDMRTGVETSDTEAVLDGDIDEFINAYLLMEAEKANQA